MTYIVGSRIDLQHINKKKQRIGGSQTPARFLYDVGTSFRLVLTENGFQAWRVIPVATAA